MPATTFENTPQRERDLCLRLYGAFAIAANVLLAVKGFVAHDPFLFTAGAGTAIAQGINCARGDEHAGATIPCIIGLAGVFTASGFYAHNLKRECFGAIKAGGVSAIKWSGCVEQVANKLPPLARLFAKLPVKKLGEYVLLGAATSLGWDGVEQVMGALRHGIDGTALALGLTTCLATAALMMGQHYFARAPDKSLCAKPRPAIAPTALRL